MDLRSTSNDRLAGGIRVLLGVLLFMAGTMKLLVPVLADAWSGQILAANLPFYTVTRWTVPFLEIVLGVTLLLGAYSRLVVVVVMGIMFVATYVHIVVDDPALFPLQPSEPIIPVIVVLLSLYILWRGAGAWSLDLKAVRAKNAPDRSG